MPLTRINTGDVGLITENNYVSHSLSNWRTYNDGDSNVPLDGTGGSPNVTFVRDSSAPLNSTGDYRFTKGGSASRRGQGVSVDFTVENRHLGKVLQVVLDYELVSGTLATDDLRLYVVQDPNGTPVLVEPVNTSLQGTVSGYGSTRHVATFQTHVSLKTYRLCVHVRSTSALDYTVDFANFRVGEPSVSTGAVITEPTRYTPVIQGSSTVTNDEVYWTRCGKNLSLSGRLQLGNVSSAEFRLFLPFIISSEVVNLRVFGRIYVNTTYTTSPQWILKGVGGQNYLTLGVADTTGNNAFTNMNITSSFGTNTILTFLCNEIPIAGWGSSVAMSSDTGDSRVVAAKYNNNNAIVGGNATWNTLDFDTHNAYTPSTGVYLVPVSGIYRVTATGSTTSGGEFFYFKRNSVTVANGGQAYTGTAYTNATTLIRCNAGDTITISYAIGSTVSTAVNNFVSFERISAGSQVLSASETVAASYYSAANQTSLTTQINFGTRIYDTHGAVTTGSSWRFTAPMSGKYSILGKIQGSTGLGGHLFKNNTKVVHFIYYMQSTGVTSFSTTVDLVAGDFIDLRPSSSATVNGGTISSTDNSYIDIFRVGN